MREIKFRAWDGEHMLGVFLDRHNDFLKDDMPIMQYTGLKDKNGVEIYEGDIVLAANEDEQKRKRLYVHYQDKQAEWQFGDKNDWGVTNMHYINKATIEVIGNIYENKELLA